MNTRKKIPMIEKTPGEDPEKKPTEDLPLVYPGLHVGSSDAFSQTENTASPDADNVSDEKLDELVNDI